MRRTLALVAGGLLLVGCTSTVAGQAGTGRAAVASTASTASPASPASTASTAPRASAAPESRAAATAATTTADPDPTGAPVPGTTPPSPEVPPGAQLPAGFYAAGSDLGYRPMTTDEFDCTADQVSGCFGILVFSGPGCPAGASVTVGIFDKSTDPDNAIGSATGTTPPIDPDSSQAVVIGDTTGVVASLTARVQEVVC